MISHRLYRENCVARAGTYLKDLRIIKNRDLRNTVIVDNSIVCFGKHLGNGIHVPSYFGQKDDNALRSVVGLLKSVAGSDDVQAALADRVGLEALYETYIKGGEGE